MFKFLRRSVGEQATEPFDSYAEVFGERMTVEALLGIRAMEDVLVDFGHMHETEREAVPPYLQEEWQRLVGPKEELRATLEHLTN